MKCVRSFFLLLALLAMPLSAGARDPSPLRVEADGTLSTIIGKRIYDRRHRAVGIIADIWFDRGGGAMAVIVQDGGFFGYPDELIALPYLSVFTPRAQGDRVAGIAGAAKRLARPGPVADPATLAASALLHAGLFAAKGQKLADVEDFTVQDGHLNQILFTFTAGQGSAMLGIPFSQLTVSGDNQAKEIRFLLTPSQAAQLDLYRSRH